MDSNCMLGLNLLAHEYFLVEKSAFDEIIHVPKVISDGGCKLFLDNINYVVHATRQYLERVSSVDPSQLWTCLGTITNDEVLSSQQYKKHIVSMVAGQKLIEKELPKEISTVSSKIIKLLYVTRSYFKKLADGHQDGDEKFKLQLCLCKLSSVLNTKAVSSVEEANAVFVEQRDPAMEKVFRVDVSDWVIEGREVERGERGEKVENPERGRFETPEKWETSGEVTAESIETAKILSKIERSINSLESYTKHISDFVNVQHSYSKRWLQFFAANEETNYYNYHGYTELWRQKVENTARHVHDIHSLVQILRFIHQNFTQCPMLKQDLKVFAIVVLCSHAKWIRGLISDQSRQQYKQYKDSKISGGTYSDIQQQYHYLLKLTERVIESRH